MLNSSIMAASKLRLVHKSAPFDLPLCRSRPRLSEEPQASRVLEEVASPACPRPLPRPREQVNASPYICAQGRSHSVTKGRNRGTVGKYRSPVRDRNPTSLSFVKSEALFPRETRAPPSKLYSDSPRSKATPSALNQTVGPRDISSELASLSFNSSFTSSQKLRTAESPTCLRPKREAKSLKSIETTFSKAVRELSLKGGDEEREVEVYKQAFGDILALNPIGKSLLMKIKVKFESWLCRGPSREEDSKNQTAHLQSALFKEMEEKTTLLRKFERISRENVELSRNYGEIQRKCEEFQLKLSQIANIRLDGFPPTEEAWKLVVAELESYKAWKTKMMRQLKASASKEQRLLELIRALKHRGYPVEEVYEADIRPHSVRKQSTRTQESDEEQLIEGPAKALFRPEEVPSLRLEAVQRNLSSASESEVSSATCEESLRKSVRSSSQDFSKQDTKVVPKLTLPMERKGEDSFQEEFMAKYSEFSESWRKQIDAMKH